MSVGQMSMITDKAAVYGVKVNFPFFIKPSQTVQLSFEAAFIRRPEPAHDLACFGQIKMKTEIIHALTDRKNVRFFV